MNLPILLPLDPTCMEAARARQDTLTKPQGSLGRLEELSIQMAGIYGQPIPSIQEKAVIVMAGDHGVVAEGVNSLLGPNLGVLLITHYQRLLNYIKPDFVHVFYNGQIVQSGGPDLALELEAKGYSWVRELFGVDRCMFESNFPPDKGQCSYRTLWNAFKRLAAGARAGSAARAATIAASSS